ncbi:hypothetical protein FUT84_06470 [Treponema phagedenis]|nr:hypothetical protein FUT84_06470 [Treponema phagedenis]QEK05858.1 hypothetical protein FUT80_03385 [Treponema phagedenis]
MRNFTNNLIPPGLSGDRQSVFHCTACGHGFIATAKAAGIFSPFGKNPKCPKCGSRKTIENSNALKGITMNELARKNTMPEKGDILMIDRGIYKHFGIYSGEQTVIHYADKSGDWGGNICIQKIPLSEFVKGATVTVCKIPQSYRRNHTVYSPEETVRRARSRL